MKGDFTRSTFKKRNHYSRVLMQQGRVQLDADWNEQLDIDATTDRTVRRDVIGHCGGPMGDDVNGNPLAGFAITANGLDLEISAGRYYVDGILVEKEMPSLFTGQLDYRNAALPTDGGDYLLYLDVWERHLTALDDPDIREVALGGPDTATRARIMGQVKWMAVGANASCSDFGPGWVPAGASSTGRLAARSEPDPPDADPCIVPEEAGYRRLENQLYRVEIHDGGAVGAATYKWSRENGSIVRRWLGEDGDTLILSSPGRDTVLGFANGDWIELIDEVRIQAGQPGTLVEIDVVDGDQITIDPSTATGPTDLASFDAATAQVRRWESAGAITVSDGDWLNLEQGVQVHFAAGQYQNGDYWLVPARTVLGDVLWDTEAGTGPEGFQLRHGIHHHYCPLALGTFGANGWADLTDCRRLFPPLTEIPRGEDCCDVTVGDGVLSSGDFDNIQAAVDSMAKGTICILPGTYQLEEPVRVINRSLVIRGCGRQSLVIGAAGSSAFELAGGAPELHSLIIRASAPAGAVVAGNCTALVIDDCDIGNRLRPQEPGSEPARGPERIVRTPERIVEGPGRIVRGPEERVVLRRPGEGSVGRLEDTLATKVTAAPAGPAIVLADCRNSRIEDNTLMGLPAVVTQGQMAEINQNRMTGGGIWVADGSTAVTIAGNQAAAGQGAGVVLGGLPLQLSLANEESGVETVQIVENDIILMANSGISTAGDIEENIDLGEVDDVLIAHNRILGNARQGPDATYDPIAVGGIVMRDCGGVRIHDNFISDNGGDGVPACGVFTYLCLGLEISDNKIVDNGAVIGSARDCLDFASVEGEGDGVLEIDGVHFACFDFDDSGPAWNMVDVAGQRALNCRFRTVIELETPADGISMAFEVGAGPNTVSVTRADGSSETQTVTSDNTSVTFSGPEVAQIVIETADNELFMLEFCQGSGAQATGYQAGVAALYAVGGEVSDPTLGAGVAFRSSGPAVMIHDNVVVCPQGQALIATGIGPMSISGNTLSSQGLRAQPPAAQSDIFSALAAFGPCVFIYNLGRPAVLGQAATGTGMAGNVNFATRLATNLRAAPTRTTVPDGRVLFHGNQVTLEVLENAPRLVASSTAVLSFDDISLQDNQWQTTVYGGIVFTSAFAAGITLRASGNRFHELPNLAAASYLSQGLYNVATDNQGTHCIIAGGGNVIEQDNHEIITTFCEQGRKVVAVEGQAIARG